jgi:hypothetical protein
MNFFKKLVEKKVEKRIAVVLGDRTPEQEVMYQEQLRIRDELGGFKLGNDPQNWLRMHQILLDYEKRLKNLESRDGHNHDKG